MGLYCWPRLCIQRRQRFNAQDGRDLSDQTAGFAGGGGLRAQLGQLGLQAGVGGDVDGHLGGVSGAGGGIVLWI